MTKYITITFQIQGVIFKRVSNSNTWYIDRTNTGLHFAVNLAANCPDPVRIMDIGTMTSHSHHTDTANSTGGAVAWLLKLQSKMLEDAYLLQCFPETHNITLSYQYYSKQEGQEMSLL